MHDNRLTEWERYQIYILPTGDFSYKQLAKSQGDTRRLLCAMPE